jgi:hypothetical protein
MVNIGYYIAIRKNRNGNQGYNNQQGNEFIARAEA